MAHGPTTIPLPQQEADLHSSAMQSPCVDALRESNKLMPDCQASSHVSVISRVVPVVAAIVVVVTVSCCCLATQICWCAQCYLQKQL
jgi:hypothetical protein